jgi:virginiamycin A acetyltransferase
VGRYVSMAPGVRVFLRNHPLERLSLHPFFYNHQLGWLAEDTVTAGTLVIEHDAWIGERAIFTPGCSRIGLGAVVGAGAVVTRDVPDFAVVAGNPAKILRYRFPAEVQDLIRNSKWWEQPIEECVKAMTFMTQPLAGEALYRHPLLAQTRGTKARVEDVAAVPASR